MSMSASLHLTSKESTLVASRLEKCNTNTLDIKDGEGNQVNVFLSIEQIKDLRDNLIAYLDIYGQCEVVVAVEGEEKKTEECPF